MANPRQRRKMRSGTAKNTVSKQTKKNMHKVTVKGPALLAAAWDKKKTVRQNYAALGLLSTANPRLAGGLEPVGHTPYAVASATPATVEDLEAALDAELSSDDEEGDELEASTSAAPAKKKEKLKPGMARIVRDEQGNVVSIIVGGQNGEEKEEKVVAPDRTGEESEDDDDEDNEEEKAQEDEENTPWGKPMKDWTVPTAEQAVQFEREDEAMEETEEPTKVVKPTQGIAIGGGVKKVGAKSDVVRQLEQRASVSAKVIRHSSNAERDWLVALVKKYDDDFGKMARDRKANVWQRTQGEIKRMINKAGGLDRLREEAAAAAPADEA
ncbi:hypothetical protein JCM8547_000117 [Rhodosporidiobolus lusitaniae]